MEQLEAQLPFLGALLKKEQDVDALRTLRRARAVATRRAGKSWGPATTNSGAQPMFLDLFYGLRDEGVPVAIQEWQTFLDALEQGCTARACSASTTWRAPASSRARRYFDAYDRVFARVFKGVEGAVGDDVTEEVLEWLRDPKNFPNLSPEELAAARSARRPTS